MSYACASRKALIAVLSCACLLAGSAAHANDVMRVGKAVAHVYMFSTPDVGLAAGTFKSNGIDVAITAFGGAARMHQAMAAGSIDIGVGSGPDMIFAAKGSPELAVAVIANRPSAIGLIVAPNSPIRSIDELRGKKIGVTSVGAVTYWLALELARAKGWGPDGITAVTLGGQLQSSIAALRTGQVDAVMESSGVGFQLEEAKEGRWIGSTDTYVEELPGQVVFASDRLMKDKPELLRRFVKGYLETVSFMKTHREETIRAVMPLTGNSRRVQEREYDQVTPLFSETGRFSAGALATVARSAVDLKLLDHEPDMSKLYTEKFLPGN